MTGLESITTIITRRRTALFGHVARLDNNVPANRALDLAISMLETAILQIRHGCALAVDHDKPGSIKLNRSQQIYAVLGTTLCCVAMECRRDGPLSSTLSSTR